MPVKKKKESYQGYLKQIEALSKVANLITSGLYLEELLRLIVHVTAEVMNSKISSLMLIDQDSREYRIYNKTSEDDHGIHVVGYKQYKGEDWFLIKDSGRSSRKGKFAGYLFFRGDFIKLKMLAITIHKDLLKDILPKIKK